MSSEKPGSAHDCDRPTHTQERLNTPPPDRIADGVEIREMELDDLAAVFALGERVFTADQWPSLYRTWDEYEVVNLYASDGEYCLVAEYEGAICGFILGTTIEKRKSSWRYGHVLWLAVDPEYRGLSIARRLHDRLTNALIDAGARMMLVDTDPENDSAMRFFKRCGYGKEVRHVYMSRNLTGSAAYRRRRRGKEDLD